MILTGVIADAVVAGTVSCAYRRWSRSRVRPGDTLLTPAGVVTIDAVDQVDPALLTDADARAAGSDSVGALCAQFRGDPDDPVFRIALSYAGPDPRRALAAVDTLTDADRAAVVQSLNDLDARSRRGPWTHAVLNVIGRRPGVAAAVLAHERGVPTPAFKRDVRRLRELGLTHSLDIGYELTPRARAAGF